MCVGWCLKHLSPWQWCRAVVLLTCAFMSARLPACLFAHTPHNHPYQADHAKQCQRESIVSQAAAAAGPAASTSSTGTGAQPSSSTAGPAEAGSSWQDPALAALYKDLYKDPGDLSLKEGQTIRYGVGSKHHLHGFFVEWPQHGCVLLQRVLQRQTTHVAAGTPVLVLGTSCWHRVGTVLALLPIVLPPPGLTSSGRQASLVVLVF